MEIVHLDIDTEVFGGNVLQIHGFAPSDDFAAFERTYTEKYHPVYVVCRIRGEDLAAVHFLEGQGFRYVDFAMELLTMIRQKDVSRYPEYRCAEVLDDDLEQVLEIAGSTFTHDRVTRDPVLGKALSGERYRRLVLQSRARANEHVLGLYDRATNHVVAFTVFKDEGNGRACGLLSGVRSEYRRTGLGLINEYFWFNELARRGFREASGCIAGANYPIVNMEVRVVGHRFVQSWVVLRKVYGAGFRSDSGSAGPTTPPTH